MTRRCHRHDDRGAITLWVLGVTLIVMFVGWFSVTLWTGSDQRRQLAAAADQAAQAGATALDTNAFRATGTRQLDPTLARHRALASLAEQDIDQQLTGYRVDATTSQVTVTLDGQVDIGLLRIFDSGEGSIAVHVTATGYPQGATP